jgi:signal transduction histidine kinase/CheY-like chemotaxis protein
MQNGLQLNRNQETLQQLNQIYLNVNKGIEEKNKQFLIINERLLKDKEKAEERDLMKSAFLANIVHDICSPMNAIKGFAELLKTPDLTKENIVKYAQIISQCSDNLLNLVHDLLDISKIEAGQLTIIERPGNIKELFDELFELFNNPNEQQKSGNVTLEYFLELKPAQYLIDADFLRLRQVLINLISNALKFTEKGYVNYGCCLTDSNTICFYVEDSGIGISLEKQAIIFDRFKQINDPNSTDRSKGTGLGLSIVKQLVELMNGKVWVESTKGIGSRFYFTMPYKKTILAKTPVKNNVQYNWSNKNILILEDDDYDIALLGKCFDKTNANCTFTKNGESVIEFIKSGLSVDLVLIDTQIPGINRFNLVRKIKKITPNLPILAQTATNNTNDIEMALNCGCNYYIPKSTNKDDLLKIIQKQFELEKCFVEPMANN